MTIAHLRTYTINKGQMDAWVKLFTSKLIPLMADHGIKVETMWVNEGRSQFIWVRSYGDTIEDVKAKETSLYGSEWWKQNVDYVRSHVAHMEIKLLCSCDTV